MRVFGLLFAVATLASGCGPTCQSTCQRAYSPNECDIKIPGLDDWTEKYDDCVDDCQLALETPGQIGDYDPDVENNTGERVILENERQAAAWMDCVEETSCEKLSDGYCAPI